MSRKKKRTPKKRPPKKRPRTTDTSDVADWSNAKKARIFAFVIGHLARVYGDHGEIRVPMSTFEEDMRVGFDRDGDDLLIVVDMDGFKES